MKNFYFFGGGTYYAGILVAWQGIEPVLPAVEEQSPKHWLLLLFSC